MNWPNTPVGDCGYFRLTLEQQVRYLTRVQAHWLSIAVDRAEAALRHARLAEVFIIVTGLVAVLAQLARWFG